MFIATKSKMSASPTPVLDFFFDCVPPLKAHNEGSNMQHAYSKQCNLHNSGYSEISKGFTTSNTDFFDERFSKTIVTNKKIQPKFDVGVYPQLPKKLVELLEEFKYTGLMLNSPWTLWVNR